MKSGLDENKNSIQTQYDYGQWQPSPELSAKIKKLTPTQQNNLHRVAIARMGPRGSFSWLFSEDNPDRLCNYENYDQHWLKGKKPWREVLDQYIEELKPTHLKCVRERVNQIAQMSTERAVERLTEIVESDNEQVARLAAMDVLKVGGITGANDSTTVNVNVKKLSDDELRDLITSAIGSDGSGDHGSETPQDTTKPKA